MQRFIATYLRTVRDLIDSLDGEALDRALAMFADAWREGRQVFVMGNGGSATTASHYACDLARAGARRDGRGFRVIGLTDNVARLTALANDRGYDSVFRDQMAGMVETADLVVGISASGDSPNVIRAFEFARESGARTLAIVGFDGGRLRSIADHVVHIPSDDYGPVEDVHLIINHLVASYLAREIVGESAP